MNRLIYGDNLLAMAALLAGDEHAPSLRGKIDLIYIDPPFDSKADYRTKITLPGGEVEQKPTVIEQFAYSDTWADGTASYLAMIVPRLPVKPGPRRVCVRVVDVFGFEAEVIKDVAPSK